MTKTEIAHEGNPPPNRYELVIELNGLPAISEGTLKIYLVSDLTGRE